MSSIEMLYQNNKLEVISVLENLVNSSNILSKSDCDASIDVLSHYMEDIKYSKVINEKAALCNICKNGIETLQKDKEAFSKLCNMSC